MFSREEDKIQGCKLKSNANSTKLPHIAFKKNVKYQGPSGDCFYSEAAGKGF